MAQQMRLHHDLHHLDSRSKHIVSDRRKAKTASREEDNCQSSSVGFFENYLSDELQASCVEMGRQLRVEARKWERSDRLEQAEYREMKRTQNLLLQVDSLAEKGAIAIERFNAYEGRAARTWQEALCVLDTMQHSHAAQLSYLREQIELRSLGLGWSDLEISWKQGGESAAQSVVRVREHFRQNVLRVEAQRRRDGLIPSEPPVPDFKAKSLKQLGMPTSDSTELASKALCSPEQMQAAIEREQQRRAEAGFSDAVQALQPKEAPHLDDAMVGKQLEICWNYISTEDNKTKVPIWCPCTVVKIADGMTDRGRDGQLLSDRAKKLAPRGMVLVEWEPDPVRGEAEATQAWYLLDPNKWQGRQTERDKDTHRAWRYHPQQLVKEQNAARHGADKTLPTQRR